MKRKAQHPMGVVTRRTGLHPDLIRAWERRHRAIEPSRTAGNRRLYTEADIRRLILIRRALEAGFQIGHVAPLGDAEIEKLIDAEAGAPPMGEAADLGAASERHLTRCLDRVQNLDAGGLERQIEAAAVELGRIELLDRLLVPLMEKIGDGCAEGRYRIANEHLATAVLRSVLDSLRAAYPVPDTAPTILVTTPVYQHHELGAMLVAATARTEAWNTVYLGPNLPAEEIAAAARKRKAQVVALGITWPQDDPELDRDLRKLGRLLPDGVTVIAGGRAVEAYREALDEIGTRRLAGLGDLRAFLRRARAVAS